MQDLGLHADIPRAGAGQADERGGVGGGRVGDAAGQIRVDRPLADHGLQTGRVGQGPVARQTAADRLAARIHVGKPADVADP